MSAKFDIEEIQMVLGVHKKENFIYLELQTSDKEILERINFTIGNSRPVKDYISQRGYKNSKLYFYNKEVKEILKDYHIVPNKTYDSSFGFSFSSTFTAFNLILCNSSSRDICGSLD